MSCDAIVIGAGPAGSMAAFLLARAGWSVAIVEKSAFPRRKVCGEFVSAPALALLVRAGLAYDLFAGAGPEVREVAVYAGDRVATAPMPRFAATAGSALPTYGRALGREHFDSRLLAAARRAGAEVWQPCRVERCVRDGALWSVHGRSEGKRGEPFALSARVIIAAHGSWDTGSLEVAGRASDLLAFKAHLEDCALPPHRMPLVAFPGGYGGLVTSDAGRVSFSCCITRRALAQCRAIAPGASAAGAVLAHVLRSTRGAREALGVDRAVQARWLAAGPLRPGIHSRCGNGYFTIGNAHGEAHPIVAEGISMAIQSAWLVCERLVRAGTDADRAALGRLARDFEGAYRRLLAPRIAAAAAFAALARRPTTAGAATAVLARLPRLLSFGAQWAGKTLPYSSDFAALQIPATQR